MTASETRTDRLLQYASAAIFFGTMVFAWVASGYMASHPAIYPYPHDRSSFAWMFAIGVFLVFIALPPALMVFNINRIVFVAVALCFMPLAVMSAKDIANVAWAGEEVTELSATVVGKRRSTGKNRACFLQVRPNGEKQIYEFAVEYEKSFQAISIGDVISLSIRPGYFDQPWVSSYGTPRGP